jgi:hypothetical protein
MHWSETESNKWSSNFISRKLGQPGIRYRLVSYRTLSSAGRLGVRSFALTVTCETIWLFIECTGGVWRRVGLCSSSASDFGRPLLLLAVLARFSAYLDRRNNGFCVCLLSAYLILSIYSRIYAFAIPQELAPRTRPHTSPRTHFLALGRGCLSRGTLPVKTRAEVRTVPRNGSGEPARAWSPAWDMIAADPCNGFQPG